MKRKLVRQFQGDYLFLGLFISLFIFCSVFIEKQMILSLWGDEITQIKLLGLDYKNINQIFLERNEANYPFFSFIYKFFYENFNLNFLNLANLNFFNLGFLILSSIIVRKQLNLIGITLYLSLIISSEYFLRQFIELRGIGLSIGLCSVFAAFFFKYIKERNLFNLICYLLSSFIFSCVHPFCGLLACSCSFIILLLQRNLSERIISSLGILFPILILLIYSRNTILDAQFFHVQGYFQHLRNTGAFMIPLIATFLMGVYLQRNLKKVSLENYLIHLSPLIISFVVIYLYSLIFYPIFQARYFSYFYPFLCLSTVFLFQKNLRALINPALFICIAMVVVLYGPRASIPYDNFKGIIENSHVDSCNKAPFYLNHGREASPYLTKQTFDLEDYILIERIYSPRITRPLKSSFSVLSSIEEYKLKFPNCKIIGATLFGESLTRKNMKEEMEKININIPVHKKTIFPCKEDSCGVLWHL